MKLYSTFGDCQSVQAICKSYCTMLKKEYDELPNLEVKECYKQWIRGKLIY